MDRQKQSNRKLEIRKKNCEVLHICHAMVLLRINLMFHAEQDFDIRYCFHFNDSIIF